MRGGGGSPVSWISTSHSVCWHGENLNLLAHWVLIFSLSLYCSFFLSLSLSYFSFFLSLSLLLLFLVLSLSLSLTSLSFSFSLSLLLLFFFLSLSLTSLSLSLSLLLLFLFLSLFYFSFSLFLSFREHSVASYSLSMETKRRGRFEKQFIPFLCAYFVFVQFRHRLKKFTEKPYSLQCFVHLKGQCHEICIVFFT